MLNGGSSMNGSAGASVNDPTLLRTHPVAWQFAVIVFPRRPGSC